MESLANISSEISSEMASEMASERDFSRNFTLRILRDDVCQANLLILARKPFDLLGTRIFLLGLRGLNPHFSDKDKFFDAEFKEMFIPTSILTKLLGNAKYLSELSSACEKLFKASVDLKQKEGFSTLRPLFHRLEYVSHKGLYLQFHQNLRPYLLDLSQSGGYTRIRVDYLFKLSSPYAIRLLELLLQYQNIKHFKEMMEIKRKMTIEELRFALNVPEGAYSGRTNNLRKYVLDEPIKEIMAKTPYIVSYTPLREGRTISSFEFRLYTYNVPKDNGEALKDKFSNDAIKALCALGFTEKISLAIFAKCCGAADCFSRINRAEAILARSKKPIRNKLGFLRKAIENNWQVEREKGQRVEKNIKSDTEQISATRQEYVDTSMTPIGQILQSIISNQTDKPPEEEFFIPPETKLRLGRRKISYATAKMYINAIRKARNLDLVEQHLKEDFNTTIEKFTDFCLKNGI